MHLEIKVSRRRSQRRRIATVISIAAIWFGGAMAAEPGGPSVMFRGAPHDMLYAIALEGQQGIAVGDFGLVVESKDGGKSWQRQKTRPTELGLFAVAKKGTKCIAAGQQGVILASENCEAWHQAPKVTNARILAVGMNGNGEAFAVGGFGTILRSMDSGATWQPLKLDWKSVTGLDAEPHLYDVKVAENGEVTVVGEFELVLRSRDGGSSWNTLHKGSRSLFALNPTASGNIYVVGQEGLIMKSDSNGVKWQELPSDTKSILTGVWADPNGKVLVSGIYSLLYSDDHGKSWRKDNSTVVGLGWHQALTGAARSTGRQANVLVVGSGAEILSVEAVNKMNFYGGRR